MTSPRPLTPLLPFLLIALGFLALYIPVYAELSQNAWTRSENGHAPFVLTIVLAAFIMRLQRLWQKDWFTKRPALQIKDYLIGILSLALGFGLYWLGRIGEVELFTTGAQLPILAGCLALIGGTALIRQLWFPLAIMLYLTIWPGWLLDFLTGPLKLWISQSATELLSAFGLPVAHSGVVIAAGPYQLFIADACAGLNSLFAMTSIGAVYLYIVKRQGFGRNAFLFLALIPIAIIANFLRVTLLIWITLQFGYDAGQVFLHDAAGLMMFAIALGSLFALDSFGEWRARAKFLFSGDNHRVVLP
jgi:exosortase